MVIGSLEWFASAHVPCYTGFVIGSSGTYLPRVLEFTAIDLSLMAYQVSHAGL